jgi:hypothetical protein
MKRIPVWRLVTVALLLSACGGSPAPRTRGAVDSGQTGPAPSAVVAGPEGSYSLALPTRWRGHFRVDSLSTAERGRALPGALVFQYLPSDTTIRPQALMVLAVYDSAAWRAVLAEGGPPPGDSVAAKNGRVYMIGLPQSNPFPPGSTDATVFQILQLRRAELNGLVQLR